MQIHILHFQTNVCGVCRYVTLHVFMSFVWCTSGLGRLCTCANMFTSIHLCISIYVCIWHVQYIKGFLCICAHLCLVCMWLHAYMCVKELCMVCIDVWLIMSENVPSLLCIFVHATLWTHVSYKYVCGLQTNEHASGCGACVNQCVYSICVLSCLHTWWFVCMCSINNDHAFW